MLTSFVNISVPLTFLQIAIFKMYAILFGQKFWYNIICSKKKHSLFSCFRERRKMRRGDQNRNERGYKLLESSARKVNDSWYHQPHGSKSDLKRFLCKKIQRAFWRKISQLSLTDFSDEMRQGRITQLFECNRTFFTFFSMLKS